MTMPVTGESGYYATVQRQAGNTAKTGLLLGPYDDYASADAQVPLARELAYEVDPRTHFDKFGVSRLDMKPGAALPAGVLNDLARQPRPKPLAVAYLHDSIPATKGTAPS